MNKEQHEHKASSYRRATHTVYEFCDCGAIRVVRNAQPEPWHACALCCPNAGA